MKEIHFKIPKNLTREKYLEVLRYTHASIEHTIWKKMQAHGKIRLTDYEYDLM